MPSRQLPTTQAPVDAPYAVPVAGVDSLTPDAVYAEWDGTSASGAFRPCVSYYNAQGVLLDRAFPPANTIAPGLKASVSYRPFNRSDGASTPPPVFVPAVARAHVTGAPFTVPGNNAQVPLTFDFTQNVTAGTNEFDIDVTGWYQVFGQAGWIRNGPGGARDRVTWDLVGSGTAGAGLAVTTIETAIGGGVFVEGSEAVSVPLFLSATGTVKVFASVTDQFGAASATGNLQIGGAFALYQMA